MKYYDVDIDADEGRWKPLKGKDFSDKGTGKVNSTGKCTKCGKDLGYTVTGKKFIICINCGTKNITSEITTTSDLPAIGSIKRRNKRKRREVRRLNIPKRFR